MIFSRSGWRRIIFSGPVLCSMLTFAVLTGYVTSGTARAEEALSTDVVQKAQSAALVNSDAGISDSVGRIPFPKPDTHNGDWLRYHGSFVGLFYVQQNRPDTGCYVCHARNDCIDCHSTRRPRDHTYFWRTRGHGLEAEANRQRCQQCHKQDYCVRCHNETAPQTHVGNWTVRHCTWCHYGSGLAPADECVVCHRVARHSSAPHAVTPSADCSVCHS